MRYIITHQPAGAASRSAQFSAAETSLQDVFSALGINDARMQSVQGFISTSAERLQIQLQRGVLTLDDEPIQPGAPKPLRSGTHLRIQGLELRLAILHEPVPVAARTRLYANLGRILVLSTLLLQIAVAILLPKEIRKLDLFKRSYLYEKLCRDLDFIRKEISLNDNKKNSYSSARQELLLDVKSDLDQAALRLRNQPEAFSIEELEAIHEDLRRITTMMEWIKGRDGPSSTLIDRPQLPQRDAIIDKILQP